MKTKLKLKKEVVIRLSNSDNFIGGIATGLCDLEPFTSIRAACISDAKYPTLCLCDSGGAGCNSNHACPSNPAETYGCLSGGCDVSYACLTIQNCGLKTDGCPETENCLIHI